jgi:hypothetical protein
VSLCACFSCDNQKDTNQPANEETHTSVQEARQEPTRLAVSAEADDQGIDLLLSIPYELRRHSEKRTFQALAVLTGVAKQPRITTHPFEVTCNAHAVEPASIRIPFPESDEPNTIYRHYKLEVFEEYSPAGIMRRADSIVIEP